MKTLLQALMHLKTSQEEKLRDGANTKDISHNQHDPDICDWQIDNNSPNDRYVGHNSELIYTHCSSIDENL